MPVTKKERRERLEGIATENKTVILHEAPHKLRTTLEDLRRALGGDRRIALCRELTKLNEEICRTTLDGAIELYCEREPRGEYVLVIEGGSGVDRAVDSPITNMTPEEAVEHFTAQGMSRNDAIKSAAKALGMTRNQLYGLLIRE